MMSSNESKPLDEQLLIKIKASIFSQEKNNVKTKKNNDSAMVEILRKLIQTEVDKNDN